MNVDLSKLELDEGWSDSDDTRQMKFGFPVHAGTGAASTSIVYVDLEAGTHVGTHPAARRRPYSSSREPRRPPSPASGRGSPKGRSR